MTARGSLWLPVCLALLAGAFAVAVLPAERAPAALAALFGPAARGPLDLHGGLRLELALQGDPAAAAAMEERLAERLRGFAASRAPTDPAGPPALRREGAHFVVELPGERSGDGAALIDELQQSGRLWFGEVVAQHPWLERLAAAAEADPAAQAAGIAVQRPRLDRGTKGPYLDAPDRAGLALWLRARPPEEQPPPPLTLGFEARPEPPEERGAAPLVRWRTHLLRPVPGLSHEQVSEAHVVFEEGGPPYAAVAFDETGRERFAALTERLVDQPLAIVVDDVVASVPIVKERIDGGRVRVDLAEVGRGPQETLHAARSLVAALQSGPLPARLVLTGQSAVPPVVSAAALEDARWAFAALVGLAVLALALVVSRLAPAPAPAPSPAAAGGPAPPLAPVAGRLAVTIACAAAVPALDRLPLALPGIDYAAAVAFHAEDYLTVTSLGFDAVLTAAVLVELGALLVPALRRRRHAGARARGPLVVAAGAVALVLAVVQGLLVLQWLGSMGSDVVALLDEEHAWTGTLPGPAMVAALCGGTAAYVLLAAVAGRFGLAAGFSTVLLGAALSALIDVTPSVAAAGLSAGEVAGVVAALAVAAGGSVGLLRARVRSADGAVALRLPAAGVVPVDVLGVLLLVPLVAATLPADGWVQVVFGAPDGIPLVVRLLIALGAALLLAWLFAWPRRLGPLAAAATGAADAAAAEATTAAVRAAVVRTWLPSALYAAGLVALAHAVSGLADLSAWDVLTAALAAAIGLDLGDEWRARRRLGALVPVWPLHRVHAADTVVRALAAAGIPAHVRGASHRTLLQLYGPYVPATVLVPPEHADAARHRIGALFAPETGAATSAGA